MVTQFYTSSISRTIAYNAIAVQHHLLASRDVNLLQTPTGLIFYCHNELVVALIIKKTKYISPIFIKPRGSLPFREDNSFGSLIGKEWGTTIVDWFVERVTF